MKTMPKTVYIPERANGGGHNKKYHPERDCPRLAQTTRIEPVPPAIVESDRLVCGYCGDSMTEDGHPDKSWYNFAIAQGRGDDD